jgi:hypothetical protein
MATKQPQTIEHEEATRHLDEKAELTDVKHLPTGNVDYTGSVAKTDPVEIRLVRKIDWRLMVSDTSARLQKAKLTTSSRPCVSCTS